MAKLLGILAAAAVGLLLVLHCAAQGRFGSELDAGEVTAASPPAEVVAARDAAQARAASARGVRGARQILFGDLHVHSSFSVDAFQLTLPLSGGDGLHPVSDACDFARFCSNLDFWSINDHAASLDGRRWRETIDAVRQCNEVAGDTPDLVSFLGWEWTQMGSTPDNHYGHKNVILRDLEDDAIPTHPIAAAPPPGVPSTFDTGSGGRLARGVGAFLLDGGHDMMRTLADLGAMPPCDPDLDVRALPANCRDAVQTPGELFARLDRWGVASQVIPHGTTWGMYTPAGSSFAKQLSPAQHDPARQRLVEIYSGHGNTEEYRPWRATLLAEAGGRRCPAPTVSYLPSCWRAGEIIRERCLAEGDDAETCESLAVLAREHFVAADRNAGPWTVPGVRPADWLDAGQCLDCFQPAFNFRPLGSVQYMLALSRLEATDARRFHFGFIASSDNHTARAGTGYKEAVRREFTDARMAEVGRSSLVTRYARPPSARSEAFDPSSGIPSVAFLENERSGSFFVTGGLAAVHAAGRDRAAVWDALQRRETYATSGPRILLWFDLLDPNAPEGAHPMGSQVQIAGTPTFRVRAVGSFEQQPGCPDATRTRLGEDRLAFLCRDECYHPSDRRRPITRVEVVRIRPQQSASEAVGPLIEDPWRRLACPNSPDGCEVLFDDPDFAHAGRDTLYYVRAIEAPAATVNGDPLGCTRDATGACVSVDPCFERPDADDCLASTEPRAWSSPIFIAFGGGR